MRAELPPQFAWTDEADVRRRLGVDDARGFITPPGSDQGACDACWAVALSQVVSDRFRIATRDPSLAQLSPVQLLRESERFCAGGSFEEGIELMQRHGIASMCCLPYSAARIAAAGRDAAEPQPPRCAATPTEARANFGSLFGGRVQFEQLKLPWKCGDAEAEQTRFRTRRTSSEMSTRSIEARKIEAARGRIQRAIYEHGPVLCRITVFDDLFSASDRARGVGAVRPFSATAGVFMCVPGEVSLYGAGTAARGSRCCRDAESCTIFGHGLAVVGWGVAEMVDVPQRGADVARLAGLRGPAAEALAEKVDAAYRGRRVGLLRLKEADVSALLRAAGVRRVPDAVFLRQRVPFWVLRNSWGTNPQSRDRDYAAGIIKVAFCGTYRVGGQERLVNLTFGVEHRHHCGYAARSAFGAQTAVCGGAIDPGVPEL